jgi:acyl carrier protein
MSDLIKKDYSIEKKVISFLEEVLEKSHGEIMPWSILNKDFDLDGESAEDLILLFSEEFKVNLQKLNLAVYFGESAQSGHILSRMLTVFGNAKHKKPLKVSDLVTAVKQGYLK